jgi:hypothetical protein
VRECVCFFVCVWGWSVLGLGVRVVCASTWAYARCEQVDGRMDEAKERMMHACPADDFHSHELANARLHLHAPVPRWVSHTPSQIVQN